MVSESCILIQIDYFLFQTSVCDKLRHLTFEIVFSLFRATNMNEHSSRSHAIFLIYIECSEVS